jgi:hypothetical protein
MAGVTRITGKRAETPQGFGRTCVDLTRTATEPNVPLLRWWQTAAEGPYGTIIMVTTEDKLESLFAKVRTLPKARQELAVEALSEIADEQTYKLSDNERAVVESGLDRAKRGEFAHDSEVDEVLNKPWS